MQNLEKYIPEIITWFVSSFLTGLGTWFLSRKKQAKEVEALELDLVERAVKIWREMSEELKKRVDVMGEQINKLQEENTSLKGEVKTLRKENTTLSGKVKKFIEKYGE
jgi:cell division protein FtsB